MTILTMMMVLTLLLLLLPGITEGELEGVPLVSYLLVRWLTTVLDLSEVIVEKREADEIAAAEAAAVALAEAEAAAEAAAETHSYALKFRIILLYI